MTDPKDAAARSRLSSLDVLRFLAAASVMVYHYTYHYAEPGDPALPLLQAITRHGYLGVEVFFIISGFVILWSAQGRSAVAFVRARILRLFPEFWVAVVVAALIFNAIPEAFGRTFSLYEVLVNLTMVPNFLGVERVDGVYWTLLVELKFYFLLWVLILFGQIPRIENWLLAWVGVSTLGLFVELPGVIRSVSMFPYGTLFAAGGLFYLVFQSGWTAKRMAALTVALPTASLLAIRGMPGFVDAQHITGVAKLATAAIIAGAFLYFATIRHNTLGAKLGRFTAIAGGLTYPLYLLHNTGKAIFLKGPIKGPEALMVVAAIIFSLAISYAVMRVGTGPIQSALRRLVDATIAKLPSRFRPATKH